MTRLWIETDIGNDVDDLGALALAHVFADRGEAELLGIGINMDDPRAAPAVAAVNAFYGRPGIPIGVLDPGPGPFRYTYAHLLADRFGDDTPPLAPAADLLRATLDAAEPASVTIVSIGMHDNLVAVLDQPGGRAAIERAVARTVVMAGTFPEGEEFNLTFRPHQALRFVREWPLPIEFLGFEVGEPVISGRGIDWSDADRNPVAIAYDYYNGPGEGRPSWDPLTIDLAVSGIGGPYALSEPGTLVLDDGARNTWHADATGRHRYVVPLKGSDALAARVDAMLSAAPRLG